MQLQLHVCLHGAIVAAIGRAIDRATDRRDDRVSVYTVRSPRVNTVLRNGNHSLHQKSWGGPSKFGGLDPNLHPVVVPLYVKPFFAQITSVARVTDGGTDSQTAL